jgi:hypothetical protein
MAIYLDLYYNEGKIRIGAGGGKEITAYVRCIKD